MAQTVFTPQKPENIQKLVGVNDGNLKLLSKGYDLSVSDTGKLLLQVMMRQTLKKLSKF